MSNTTCAECNSEIPEGTELCPECGFPTEAGKVSCPECLNPVSLSLDACPECGFPLDSLRENAAAGPAVPADSEPAVPQADPEPALSAAEEPAAAVDVAPEVAAEMEPAVPAEELARATADDLDEPAPEAAEPEEVPVEAAPSQEPPSRTAPAIAQETIVLSRIEAGDEVTDAVHQAQIDSLNALTGAISRLIESGGSGTAEDLALRVNELLNGAEAGKNEMLTDLISSISNFVETTQKIKDEMLNELKEQNLTTVSTMQQLAETLANDTKAAAEGIANAQKGAIAEINNLAQQIKAAAAREAAPKSDVGDYLLYICLAVLFFIAINIAATAYVVKLVR